MPARDDLSAVRATARGLLSFVPVGEREHYRCPRSFPRVRLVSAAPVLSGEVDRFFEGASGEGEFRLDFREEASYGASSFSLDYGGGVCVITAGGAEGFRRGIYELEAQITGGELKSVRRRDWVVTRLGRIFCAPINRPPLYHDELVEETEYYSDAYLNELARSGVNGVWVSSDFRKLTGDGSERRLAKLRRIVETCGRYGIGVYVFCIEPIAFEADDPRLVEHPELGGPLWQKKRGFCPSSSYACSLLEETTRRLFTAVPDLAGILDLTVGEWYTLCCNMPHFLGVRCPQCGETPAWQTLNRSLSAMLKGMRSVNPRARLISWPYTMSGWWSESEALEAATHPLEGVPLCHNFESGGGGVQLGRYRKVKDYWLSYIGPSAFYSEMARRQISAGGEMFAKLQVCCSTEIATTGYLPVPALLYRKYSELRRLGVSGVLMGWYFGTYPSLMTRAALRLSQEPFPKSERSFLLELARERWGASRASSVARIWKAFSDAFGGYPLCNQLAYTGPMHDSIAWPLYVFPVNKRLTPSWDTRAGERGDRIFDCLLSHFDRSESFTPEDTLVLLARMARKWSAAAASLACLDDGTLDLSQRLEIHLAQAVGLIFEDAADIFRFYMARDILCFGASPKAALRRMRAIAERALARSRAMLAYMAENPVLGYHCEATDYRFTAQEVQARITQLTTCLQEDFPRAERLLSAGQRPLGAFSEGRAVSSGVLTPLDVCGVHETRYAGAYPSDHFTAVDWAGKTASICVTPCEDGWRLVIQAPDSPEQDSYSLWWEPLAGHPSEVLNFKSDGTVSYWPRAGVSLQPTYEGLREGGYVLTLHLPRVPFGDAGSRHIRFNLQRTFQSGGRELMQTLVAPHYLRWVYTLSTRDTRDSVRLVVC